MAKKRIPGVDVGPMQVDPDSYPSLSQDKTAPEPPADSPAEPPEASPAEAKAEAPPEAEREASPEAGIATQADAQPDVQAQTAVEAPTGAAPLPETSAEAAEAAAAAARSATRSEAAAAAAESAAAAAAASAAAAARVESKGPPAAAPPPPPQVLPPQRSGAEGGERRSGLIAAAVAGLLAVVALAVAWTGRGDEQALLAAVQAVETRTTAQLQAAEARVSDRLEAVDARVAAQLEEADAQAASQLAAAEVRTTAQLAELRQAGEDNVAAVTALLQREQEARQALAASLALTRLTAAVRGGGPFEEELRLAAELLPEDSSLQGQLATLAIWADLGLPPRELLRSSFELAVLQPARRVTAASVVASISESFDAVGAQLRPIEASLRPVGEAFRPVGEALRPLGEALRPVGDSLRPVGESLRPVGESLRPITASLESSFDDLVGRVLPDARSGGPLITVVLRDLEQAGRSLAAGDLTAAVEGLRPHQDRVRHGRQWVAVAEQRLAAEQALEALDATAAEALSR